VQPVEGDSLEIEVFRQQVRSAEARLRNSSLRVIVGLRQHVIKLMGQQSRHGPSIYMCSFRLRVTRERGTQKPVQRRAIYPAKRKYFAIHH